MKKIKYLLLIIMSLSLFSACTDDDGKDPAFGDNEIYLYGNWSVNRTAKLGDVLKISGMDLSPSTGDYTYKWILDGKVISDKKDLEFKLDQYYIGVPLRYEVTRSTGASTFREATLLVARDFVPKSTEKKTVGFVTPDATISDIDWESVTHIIYSGATVDEAGKITYKDEIGTEALINFAHHYGVYISLECSGALASYLNCAPVYASYTFYDNAVANPQGLASSIVETAKSRGFDGINILMDKANTANGAFEDPVKLKEFYQEVGTTLKSSKNTIDGNEYDYLLSMSVWGGWTRGSVASAVNIEEYDWVNVLAFGAEDLAPTPHSAQWFAEQEVDVWLGWQGPIDPDRLVLVLPSFGLRYFGIPDNYTWGNLGTFTEYISYKNLVARDSDAPNKDKIAIKDYTGDKSKEVDVTYYDGLPSVRNKAAYAISKDIAGLGLWAVESDVKDNNSLLKQIKTSLGD